MGLIIFFGYTCWCKFGKKSHYLTGVLIEEYLEGEVGHTMFINPVDDQEIIRTLQSCKH